ncbi:cyclic nucleotide-gated ion channel 1 isoform X2 [Rosa chinensis]|uniref:cyclic nucleotide-gated ion channel 1 isoform X2 n=1 Tax=Rosa chinensis TaxID=74649 RepID=UPI001AD9215F|nr:cyclic nucleotide-gated ion channel 1 isoform X2 [Rosa chinensis]
MTFSTARLYRYIRFLSHHPILGFVSFIAHIIPVYLCPFIRTVDLLAAGDVPVVALPSVVYLFLDPLFLYAPLINGDTKCLVLDHRLKITALVFRSWGDLHYLVKMFEGLRRKSPISKKLSGLAIDTLAILPIPQVTILGFLPKMRGSNSLKTMNVLTSLIVLQYLPRGYPLYQLCSTWNTWTIGGTGYKLPNWSLIVINIYGYIIASHIFGAFWYFFSIQREIECWEHACRIENGCEFSTSCVQNTYRNITLLKNLCPIDPPNKQIFDFGIFRDALQSGIQGSTNFSQKWLRCFSWGIRNLSSFGSNLGDTSAYGWENLFVVLISISGLLLFMYLLGHVQEIMQKVNKPIKEMINIRSILHEYGMSDDENHGMEKKIKLVIRRKLFMDKLKKVEGLKDRTEEVLEKICECLEPMIYRKGCYIIREGEPLDMMFFVTWGNVLTYATNNGGSNGSSGTIQHEKEKDDLYGKELLTWAEERSDKLSYLPISPITVKSHNKVEVFALQATVLQLVVSKFQSQFNLTIAVDNEIVN